MMPFKDFLFFFFKKTSVNFTVIKGQNTVSNYEFDNLPTQMCSFGGMQVSYLAIQVQSGFVRGRLVQN